MQAGRTGEGAKVQVRGVVFDYGKVLCLAQQPVDIEGMAAVCEMPVPRFQQLYWKFRIPYDRGALNGESYWSAVSAEEGMEFRREQIAELVTLDARSWSRPNLATLAWVEQLRDAGLRLGVLSNMPREVGRYLETSCDWFSWFHSRTFSCDVRQVKPGPAIYEICLKGMGLDAGEVLFLDDIAANVDGALAVGIHGVLFDTLEQTAARLAKQFDLPLPDFGKSAV